MDRVAIIAEKFVIKDFSNKCDQIHIFLRICHNYFIICAAKAIPQKRNKKWIFVKRGSYSILSRI